MSSSISIAFVGPIAAEGENPRGGYHACNQRTIMALRGMAVDVAVFRYPAPSGSRLNKGLRYLFGFAAIYWRLLLTEREIVHLTGLYRHFIYIELLLVALARAKGRKVVFDIRAGYAQKHYSQRTPLYRWAFRTTLKCANSVMVEGAEYIEFVRELVGRSPYLLPNHVSLSGVLEVRRPNISSAADEIALIYAGRLVPNKGIEVVLQAASILRRHAPRVRLRIAGDGERSYVDSLKERYADPGNEWLGSISSVEVLNHLSVSHFFLFPTTHAGEGHSNALTEAMAAGCVPLASRNGFNQSVIGNCGRVFSQSADAAVYVQAIIEIIRLNQWDDISAAAMLRARECFETDRVVAALVDQYKRLGDGTCH